MLSLFNRKLPADYLIVEDQPHTEVSMNRQMRMFTMPLSFPAKELCILTKVLQQLPGKTDNIGVDSMKEFAFLPQSDSGYSPPAE